ncbi:MAG: NERD domain-containing protein, partial [Pseudomonadota bacterium]|nr:NERD domain-containing protein [Pseudomonadota bacterium]
MALLLIAVLVLFTLIVILLRRRLGKTRKERQLEKILRHYKQDEVLSLVIPDGIGGLMELDRLILTDRGLLLIETYPMTG